MSAALRTAMIVALTIAVGGVATGVRAQQTGFKRTVLQQADISAPGREIVTAVGEFQPGASPGRHTHPGEEVGYVLEGPLLLERDGKPNVTLHAGQPFLIPAGTVHNATNSGTAVPPIVATYILHQGTPL